MSLTVSLVVSLSQKEFGRESGAKKVVPAGLVGQHFIASPEWDFPRLWSHPNLGTGQRESGGLADRDQ